jgi:ribosomal protein S18 acetylase RimI-like enzyme
MAVLQEITPQVTQHYKDIRLRALQDTPSAFGSTFARESQFSDQDWIARALNLCTDRSIGYLAIDRGQYCGIAAAFLDEHKAQLVSMWVAPDHRRSGIGRLLIDAIQSWTAQRGANTLALMVTSNNHAAIEFYKRNGFTMTGHTEPYPNDPALIEHEMSKSVL